MSVTIEEVINHGGYNLNDIEDAKWLLSQQSEFNELIEKAEELVDMYEEWQDAMDEMEDSGDYGHKMSFEDWRKIYDK